MQNETILCISPRTWDSLWRDTQQIMSRMAKQNRILYFEPGRDPDYSAMYGLRNSYPNLFSLKMTTVQENLIVIPTPPQLPQARKVLPRSILQYTMPVITKINAELLTLQIRRTIKALGDVQDPILWLYDPYDTDLIGHFDEKWVSYYVYDEFAEFTSNQHISDLIHKREKRTMDQADVIFASSQSQYDRRKAVYPDKIFFIPNAVDFDLFNRALEPDLPVPADIADLPRPIIGFAGWLGGFQIDVELLCYIAETFAEGSLVLVGPDALYDNPPTQKLRNMTNVHFLGQKHHEQLPNYLQLFDVALMPYMRVGHVGFSQPLKLLEYLAAGRAIVSIALDSLIPYADVLYTAETHDDFITQIRTAMTDYSPEIVAARVAAAQKNTWDSRVEDIYAAFAEIAQNK